MSPRSAWKKIYTGYLTREPLYHLVAILSVLSAAILTYAATFFLDGKAPLAFFVIAVIISSARGTITGLLATALSSLVLFSIFGRNTSIELAANNGLAIFVGVGLVTNLVFHKLHLMNSALKTANGDIEKVNLQLLEQAEFLADANARLARQKEALSEAHERLRQLTSRSAHSIQSPLKNISDSTALLVRANSENSGEYSEQVSEVIRIEIERIEAMLRDLGDASRNGSKPVY